MFDTVYKTVGQIVGKGDKLIDIYSTDLAEAKGAYAIKHIQWLHDKKLLEIREPLAKSNTIAQQLLLETRNDETEEPARVRSGRR